MYEKKLSKMIFSKDGLSHTERLLVIRGVLLTMLKQLEFVMDDLTQQNQEPAHQK